MKFFKNILPLVALCTICSVHPRTISGGAPAPVVQPKPTTPPAPIKTPIRPPMGQPAVRRQPQPVPQPQSYAQALEMIKKMTSESVLVNNAFTQGFINFVKSLNLSEIETKALLEAGANIYAVWTDDNAINKKILLSLRGNIDLITQSMPRAQPREQIKKRKEPIPAKPHPKPIPQPQRVVQPQPVKESKPIPQIAPMKEHFITNNVVMTLDPEKTESVTTMGGAMVQQALLALYEKASPVIMTSNILEIIIKAKQQVGDSNLQKLRNIDIQNIISQAQYLRQSHHVNTMTEHLLILLSYINFDSKHVNCYFHKSAHLVLLIPKEYIQANLPQALNFNLADQAKVCGFNPAVLTALPDITTANLVQQLHAQQSMPIDKEAFITNLTAMFIPQKKGGELISPEYDTKWIIYLTGHGGPAFQTIGQVRQQFNMIQQSLVHARNALRRGQKTSEAQKYVAEYEPRAKEYEKILQGKSEWLDSQLVPESAHIAGISAPAFSQLMKFFDTHLNVAYLHYTTCFAGGSNQTFVNDVLSSLDVDFIVSSEGAHEGYTTSQLGIKWSSQKPRMRLTHHSFAEFFKLLRLFFTQQEQFVKIKGKMKDPIIAILRTISPENIEHNQPPFVRFPGAGFFAAISNKKTEILTRTMVKAHEIEKRPIDLSKKNISTLIVTVPRITVPINLGKKTASGHTAIVSPSPKTMIPAYEAMHVFKEINFENTMQAFLFNCVYLNARYYTQTFVVNTLTGILYQQSGLPNKQGSAIKNLIIQMKGVAGTGSGAGTPMQLTPLKPQDIKLGTVGLNVQVAFELTDVVYQCMFAVKNFEKPDEISQNIEKITFTATPIKSMNMNSLASNFVTQQEISQIRKPITLESIAKYIDSKIDKQDVSMAIQSQADNEALLKFAKERVK